MKQGLLLLLILISSYSFAQQPEQVYSITEKQKDYTYYNEQAGLWEKEINKSTKNANAWMNYFTAARMNNMFAKEGNDKYDLKVIAKNLKANLPNSFEDYYVSYKLENNPDLSYVHLQKAYDLDSNRYETWEAFITKAEKEGDTEAMKSLFEKWYRHEMYSPGLSTWNYNAIIGLDQNAIFITFGDNDTYPIWFLQTIKNIRTDVTNLNASLLVDDKYRANKFKALGIPAFEKTLEEMGDYKAYRDELIEHILNNTERPSYIGMGSPRSFRDKHHEQLFIVGLAFKYCKEDFDHLAVIRNNYENLFLKDDFKSDLDNDFSQSVVDFMSQQYIPCFTVLYKHYLLSGEERKAAELEKVLIRIGEKSQRQDQIAGFLEKQKQ